MSDISVIIPTLNEAQNIKPLLTRLFQACSGMSLDVVVVDDNSLDGTSEAVRQWAASHPVRLIFRKTEKGLAGAIQEGARHGESDILVVMDADLSHAPEDIPRLIEPIRNGRADMVVGSRYVSGGGISGWPLSRKCVSRLSSWLARPISGIRDPLSGFFAVRKSLVASLPGPVPGFKIGLEIIARHKENIRVREIPIHFQDRRQGRSKADFRVMLLYLYQLFSLLSGGPGQTAPFFPLPQLAFGMAMDLVFFSLLAFEGISVSSANAAGFLTAVAMMGFIGATRARGRTRLFEPSWRIFLPAGMTLFMRGGMLPSLTAVFGFYPSVVVSIGLSWVCFGILSWGLSPLKQNAAMTGISDWKRPALVLLAYFTLLRLFYMGLPELIMEEAYYWNYAKHLDIGYLDHPPMVAWLIWLTTRLFGDTEFGVRLGAFACWGIAAFFIWRWTSRLFDKQSALLALLLMAVLPYFFGTGLVISPDAPLTTCWAGALFFFHQGLVENRRSAWPLAGLWIGLGLLSKYTIALLGPSVLVYMALSPDARKWLRRPEPYLAAVIALLVFLPVIVWNANHDWASFYFQGPKRINAGFHFTLDVLFLSVFLMLTPAGLCLFAAILRDRWQNQLPYDLTEQAPKARSVLFFMAFTLTPLLVFIFFSLFRQFKPHWAGPLWLAMIPVMGNRIAHIGKHRQMQWAPKLQTAWPATFMILAFLYGGGLYYLTLGIPGVPFPGNLSLLGWKSMGEQIERISDGIYRQTGKSPLVVGMDKYKTASGIAFYRVHRTSDPEGVLDDAIIQSTTSQNIFGGNGLMYHYWISPGNQEGRTMILVACDPDDLRSDKIGHYFNKMGDLRAIGLSRNGKSTGQCYYRIAEGYRVQTGTAMNSPGERDSSS